MSEDAVGAYVKVLAEKLRYGDATERTHYPALEAFVKSLGPRLNIPCEPSGIPGASVDFLVRRGQQTIGHIEAKDIGKSLDEAPESKQLKRYRSRFSNLVLTDFLEFRWFIDGDLRTAARVVLRPNGIPEYRYGLAGRAGRVAAARPLRRRWMNHCMSNSAVRCWRRSVPVREAATSAKRVSAEARRDCRS